ncbi:hypothetical protein CGLO_15722 [Colletotrichum gloeosporioides Cg-14]|uniref:Alcohol dehydrogenase-like C-terminal domain-containing protein n=1 Tax=Colletotrichum gloeosporioides (strain Cg-14) TaxID=1237896 RepID=T0LAT1_COLGC|nr:hypothetical protein CGLO_15722 [Colletotrichum gloeosporioides Cg-14]
MSSWMALSARAAPQKPGFTVVILGATSASGRVAVDVLDERIVLKPETDWSKLGEVDVVLDYVYGDAAAGLLKALPKSEREVQYIHIGSVSRDETMMLPGAILRGKRVALRGAGPGSWTMEEYAKELGGMVEIAAKLERKGVAVEAFKDVESAWGKARVGGDRIVFVSDDIIKSA